MNNLRLPTQDSATGRGVKTGIQTIGGLILAFLGGLLLTVWHVPGVPTAILNYVQSNFLQVALTLGVPAGLVGFIWNYFRKGIPNY